MNHSSVTTGWSRRDERPTGQRRVAPHSITPFVGRILVHPAIFYIKLSINWSKLMMKKEVNKKVNVTAVWFDKDCEAVPKRIEFEGRSYTFVDRGLRYCIKHGEQITRLFDLSDGESQFRLKNEGSDKWNLLWTARQVAR